MSMDIPQEEIITKKRPLRNFMIVFVLSFLAIAGIAVYLILPPASFTQDETIVINKGDNLGAVADRLESQKVIKSSLALKILARLLNTEKMIITGYYRVKTNSTLLDVHDLIISGHLETLKVTIPEGWTKKKMAERFESLGLTSIEEFYEACRSPELLEKYGVPGLDFEGYLFPDTYTFPRGVAAEGIVDSMVYNFFKIIKRIEPDYESWGMKKLHDKIIMASIIEREYRIKEEAPIIASVFYNRLRRNVGLESCATLEYVITVIQDKEHPKFITREMQNIDSEYNTYKWAGLPPGPISNPGFVALDAAFNPAITDYWFFVVKDTETGEHYFSEDLDTHNEAKYFYLKGIGRAPEEE
ncbi:MAG: endolytic transglycosylase MltG [Spirochaetales bacterium]|nr:endolytic transglycosylase MltG [Spirochaetales bacterium]